MATALVRTLGPIGTVLSMAAATVACAEDVDFSSQPMADASSLADVAGADRATAPDGAPCTTGSVGCQSNGQLCAEATDCCSGRCEQGYCLPPGTCSPPGTPCSSRSTCCSGRCNPDVHGALSCAEFCQANGTPCSDAQQCCSLACNAGACGGPICLVAGTSCTTDADCCSDRCETGRCVTVTACLPTGEGCAADAGGACCSGVCDPVTTRCDLGPGSCLEVSSPCVTSADCCRGSCTRDAQAVPTCTAPCLGEGQDCNSNGDCCQGVCGGAPSTCTACP